MAYLLLIPNKAIIINICQYLVKVTNIDQILAHIDYLIIKHYYQISYCLQSTVSNFDYF